MKRRIAVLGLALGVAAWAAQTWVTPALRGPPGSLSLPLVSCLVGSGP